MVCCKSNSSLIQQSQLSSLLIKAISKSSDKHPKAHQGPTYSKLSQNINLMRISNRLLNQRTISFNSHHKSLSGGILSRKLEDADAASQKTNLGCSSSSSCVHVGGCCRRVLVIVQVDRHSSVWIYKLQNLLFPLWNRRSRRLLLSTHISYNQLYISIKIISSINSSSDSSFQK